VSGTCPSPGGKYRNGAPPIHRTVDPKKVSHASYPRMTGDGGHPLGSTPIASVQLVPKPGNSWVVERLSEGPPGGHGGALLMSSKLAERASASRERRLRRIDPAQRGFSSKVPGPGGPGALAGHGFDENDARRRQWSKVHEIAGAGPETSHGHQLTPVRARFFEPPSNESGPSQPDLTNVPRSVPGFGPPSNESGPSQPDLTNVGFEGGRRRAEARLSAGPLALISYCPAML
jgi:hypothetical protein